MKLPFPKRLLRPHAATAPPAADHKTVSEIHSFSTGLTKLADSDLPQWVDELRSRVIQGATLTDRDVIVPSFALTLEATRRALGLTYYDVQLLAGLSLARGMIAEMRTGEGKTIVVALPACLHALTGQGVHVATVNRYLAERDFEQMSAIFRLLGFTSGLAEEQAPPASKRSAYACDITYATGYELGFDFLRDQTCLRDQKQLPLGESFRRGLRGKSDSEAVVTQRGYAMAIIDEADSVLIDEANTPLVLSGASSEDKLATTCYAAALDIAKSLKDKLHYNVDAKTQAVRLTDSGLTEVFEHNTPPTQGLVRPWTQYIEQALRAQQLQNNVDYVVRDDSVMIVDQYTGRIFTERTWRDGLHQSVEQKEGVAISPEQRSMARVSRQRFFRMYETICGMTGTAQGLESELHQFYGARTVAIPERLENQRRQVKSRYFRDSDTKLRAIALDIAERHRLGQPILVGTRTISESISISELLKAQGIAHELLNGVQDNDEADIISAAGTPYRVTIATNMAGRGTDIKLSDDSLAAGGLHVIATEHQASQRVDRQLIGRAARQGQAGSCQVFVSGEDELLIRNADSLAERLIKSCKTDGESTTNWSREVRAAQQLAEKESFEQRKQLFQHDSWLNGVLTTVAERNRAAKKAS